MSNFVFENPNPQGKNVGDCTVRAIAIADGKAWDKVWSIIGELMDALKVLNPKLYSRTIERLTAID